MGILLMMVIQPPSLVQALSAAPAGRSPAQLKMIKEDILSSNMFLVSKREKTTEDGLSNLI